MKQYLDLLRKIVDKGEDVQSGAMLRSEDRKPTCRFLLAPQLRFDLRDGFPIVTTKPVPFDLVVDEVLWFLRGQTNVGTLGRQYHNDMTGERVFIQRHIWDQWARPDGDVPHIYGERWRRWPYPGAVWHQASDGDNDVAAVETWDQVDRLIQDLRAVKADPACRARRRIILTAWDPPLVHKMGLPPCHTSSQWLPTNGYLDCVTQWRSIDTFTGMPFNVVQYALLLHVFARLSGLIPRELVCNIADCHLYDNQFDQVREQLTREPRPLPQLAINPKFFRTCPDLSVAQLLEADPAWFSLDGYDPHRGRLRAEVAV